MRQLPSRILLFLTLLYSITDAAPILASCQKGEFVPQSWSFLTPATKRDEPLPSTFQELPTQAQSAQTSRLPSTTESSAVEDALIALQKENAMAQPLSITGGANGTPLVHVVLITIIPVLWCMTFYFCVRSTRLSRSEDMWRHISLVTAAMMPYFDQKHTLSILRNMFRGTVVAANYLYGQNAFRDFQSCKSVVVVWLACYAMFFKLANIMFASDWDSEQMRSVICWICMPLATMLSSELHKFLKWLKTIIKYHLQIWAPWLIDLPVVGPVSTETYDEYCKIRCSAQHS